MARVKSPPSLLSASASFIVWLIYFLVVYLLLEFGCPLGWDKGTVLGINVFTLVLLAVTVPAVLLIGLYGLRGYRDWRAAVALPNTGAALGARFFSFLSLTGAGLALIATGWTALPIVMLAPCR